jgi:hypothetical protein
VNRMRACLHMPALVLLSLLWLSVHPHLSIGVAAQQFELYLPAAGARNASWTPRCAHSATLVGSAVVVIGGFTTGRVELDDVLLYNPSTKAWSTNVAAGGTTSLLAADTALCISWAACGSSAETICQAY